MHRFLAGLIVTTLLGTTIQILPISAQEGDSPLMGGRFYTQASGKRGLGYAVIDDESGPFYSEFRRLGGPNVLGFPISKRFKLDGTDTQVFERLVLQGTAGVVDVVPVFDLLGAAGFDGWLQAVYEIPLTEEIPETDALAVLDDSPVIKSAYYGVAGDPRAVNGLPKARIASFSAVRTLRAQRAAIFELLTDEPRGRAGDAVFANSGEIARESGIYPSSAFVPETLAQAAASSSGGPAVGLPKNAPATPQVNVGDELKLAVAPSTKTPAGGSQQRVIVKVMDQAGNPLPGAVVIVILHYPLKNENEAYTVDGVFFGSPADANGNSIVDYTVDGKVPSGVGFTMEVSAIYPPGGGRVEIPMAIG